MNTIYATALLAERFIRPNIFSRKRRVMIPIGICLMYESKMLQYYNLSWRPNSKEKDALMTAMLPHKGSDMWLFYSDILIALSNFFAEMPADAVIVADTSNDVLTTINNMLIDAGIEAEFDCATISERKMNAASWLPETIYGAASDFLAYYPRKEGASLDTEHRLNMFMSHEMFSDHMSRSRIYEGDLAQEVIRLEILNDTINKVIAKEIAKLQSPIQFTAD